MTIMTICVRARNEHFYDVYIRCDDVYACLLLEQRALIHIMSCSVVKLLANIVIYMCAITVGVMSYYMADRKHRKAFLEARQSLEVKLNLEEQSQQQVGIGRVFYTLRSTLLLLLLLFQCGMPGFKRIIMFVQQRRWLI